MVLSGCLNFGDNYSIHTTVFEDGSLERKITATGDSSLILKNNFDAYAQTGWMVDQTEMREKDSTETKYTQVHFTRTFTSIDEANAAMSDSSAANFKITAASESTFKWFYTDLTFSDTYTSTIRFQRVKADDFFSEEDYALMEKRGREGRLKWNKDSVRMQMLQKQLDSFMEAGFNDEFYLLLCQLFEKKGLSRNWQDTLKKYNARVSLASLNMRLSEVQQLLNDTLNIPVQFNDQDQQAAEDMVERCVVGFFDDYKHSITMPYDIVESNADSVNGKDAFWDPREIGPKDVTMTVTARKVNYLSIMFTVFLFAAGVFGYRVWESTRTTKG